MKKFAKVIALILCFALIAAFAACAGKPGDDTTTTAAPDAEPASTEAPADAAGAFKIGLIGPLTGGAAIYGNAAKNGAQIAVDEINAKGGIQFEYKAEDDEHDAEKSVNAYNTLVDWGMQALVGPITTKPAVAVSAEAFADRIFCLTPSASSTDVIDNKDNMFQVCFTDPNQGTASADYIAENLAGKKVAVIYKNDDAYSQGIRDTFVKEAAAKNVEVAYEGTFTEATSTDFSVQVTAAQAAEAEIVFLPMYYEPASVILKQAKDIGYSPVFFGVDGMDGILSMEGFDTSLAEGVMLLTPFSADDPNAADFVKAYQDAYGEIPNQFAADGYDAVYTIYQALQEAECTADMSAADICEKLVSVMPTISVDGLTGKGMTWDASGAVSKAPMAVVIKDGVYVTP